MEKENRETGEGKLEGIISEEIKQEENGERNSFYDLVKQAGKNWAIDTTAKIWVFVPLLATMEGYNGLNTRQIIGSRVTSALIDTFLARIYTKTADYLYNKFSVDQKKGGLKAWVIDTASMIGTYAPAYAGILYANGADYKQIASASAMAAGIATLTSRPFRKYVLFPWRKFWNFRR